MLVFAGSFAQQAQGILVGRLIAGSQEGKCSRAFRSCFHMLTPAKYLMLLRLQSKCDRGCKPVPYHNLAG